MPNRWPTRPETLVARFERAVLERAASGGMSALAQVVAQQRYDATRRDLLARVWPASRYQIRRQA